MKILFISCGLSVTVGGTERVMRVLMQHFEDMGHQCYVTYCMGDDTAFPNNRKQLINYRATYSKFEKMMDAFCMHAHTDIIINENVCELNVSKWLKKNSPHIPVVYCLHNTPKLFSRPIVGFNLHAIKNRLHKTITGRTIYMWKHLRMYNICDYYVVLSPSYINDFYRIFKQSDEGKVISISNPISMKTNGMETTKEKIFLVVARLSEKQKNIGEILRIWKEFSVINKDYKLQIVGYGPDEQLLHDYAKSLCLQRIEFVGKTNLPQKYYTHAKFFLMTSHFEGLPMTIIEALQFGCIPIVYNSFSAIEDIIVSGENGILIPKNDAHAFLQTMVNLVNDEEKQAYLKNNISASLHKFSIENIGEQWNQLFLSIKNIRIMRSHTKTCGKTNTTKLPIVRFNKK